MNTAIQSIIVWGILIVSVVYVIRKIVNIVRCRRDGTASCRECGKSCPARKINQEKREKSK